MGGGRREEGKGRKEGEGGRREKGGVGGGKGLETRERKCSSLVPRPLHDHVA